MNEQVKNSPYVTGPPFIRFYAGAALIVDGLKVGALCVMDNEPREEASFTESDRAILLDLAGSLQDTKEHHL